MFLGVVFEVLLLLQCVHTVSTAAIAERALLSPLLKEQKSEIKNLRYGNKVQNSTQVKIVESTKTFGLASEYYEEDEENFTDKITTGKAETEDIVTAVVFEDYEGLVKGIKPKYEVTTEILAQSEGTEETAQLAAPAGIYQNVFPYERTTDLSFTLRGHGRHNLRGLHYQVDCNNSGAISVNGPYTNIYFASYLNIENFPAQKFDQSLPGNLARDFASCRYDVLDDTTVQLRISSILLNKQSFDCPKFPSKYDSMMGRIPELPESSTRDIFLTFRVLKDSNDELLNLTLLGGNVRGYSCFGYYEHACAVTGWQSTTLAKELVCRGEVCQPCMPFHIVAPLFEIILPRVISKLGADFMPLSDESEKKKLPWYFWLLLPFLIFIIIWIAFAVYMKLTNALHMKMVVTTNKEYMEGVCKGDKNKKTKKQKTDKKADSDRSRKKEDSKRGSKDRKEPKGSKSSKKSKGRKGRKGSKRFVSSKDCKP